jgi:hypothetical protein
MIERRTGAIVGHNGLVLSSFQQVSPLWGG